MRELGSTVRSFCVPRWIFGVLLLGVCCLEALASLTFRLHNYSGTAMQVNTTCGNVSLSGGQSTDLPCSYYAGATYEANWYLFNPPYTQMKHDQWDGPADGTIMVSDYGTAPGTNVISITCFTWTNNSALFNAIAVVKVLDVAGGAYDVPGMAATLVAPKGVIERCITNSGASPAGYGFCDPSDGSAGGVLVYDARVGPYALGSEAQAVEFNPTTCYTNAVVATNGISYLTNKPGPIWDQLTNLISVTASTNLATSQDINRAANATVLSGAAVADELEAVRAAVTNASVVAQSNAVAQAGYLSLIAGAATNGPVSGNGGSTNVSMGVGAFTNFTGLGGWKGLGTNIDFRGLSNLVQGLGLTNFGLGTNQYGLSPTNLFGHGWLTNGSGTNGLEGLELGTVLGDGLGGGDAAAGGGALNAIAVEPDAPWGVIYLGTIGATTYSIDLKEILSLSALEQLAQFVGLGGWGVPGTRSYIRLMFLWGSLLALIFGLAHLVYECTVAVCQVPQLPNYDATFVGTTVLGVNEMRRLVAYSIFVAIILVAPAIIVTFVSTIVTFCGFSAQDPVSAIQGGGMVAASGSSMTFRQVFWLVNQWFPLVEEVFIAVNGLVAVALARSTVVIGAVLAKIVG